MADDVVKSEGIEASAPGLEGEKWHPSFNAADADVVLCSKDGTSFRVHRHSLCTASGWFSAMFTVPQAASQPSVSDSIRVDENEDVLAGLLKMITGLEAGLGSVDFLESILVAAEKYEMHGPVSIVRAALLNPLLDAAPLALYRITSARGWIQEAKWASARTLTLDLCTPESTAELRRLDGPSVTALMLLHRRRRDGIRDALEDKVAFSAGNATSPACSKCQKGVVPTQWNAVKYSWISRMESTPFGATLTIPDILESKVMAAVDAKCPNCGAVLYTPSSTMERLYEVIAGLPQTVE